jgi:zinc protease
MAESLLDRTLAPQAAPLQNVLFPAVRLRHLSNGIPVHLCQFGGQEVMELSLGFPAGRCYEDGMSVASFTSKIIQEGTRSMSALEFARRLDFFGASLHIESGMETATVGLTTLTKHFGATVALLKEMLVQPAFTDSELQKLKQRTVQHLDVEEKKTAYVARKNFNRLLFGADHAYGRNADKADIEAIEMAPLVAFHQRHFNLVNADIVLCGRFDEDTALRILEEHLGQAQLIDPAMRVHASESRGLPLQAPPAGGFHYQEMADVMQGTIRVGHRAFPRKHPDYQGMQVTTTLLGGYFGSRLMKNIREDKGYTYGIGAGWIPMKYSGIFIVQTDVGNNYLRATLDEIAKEMDKLLQHGVEEGELRLVKNYMLGRSASERETPAQIAGYIRSVLLHEIPFAELDEKFAKIQAITPDDVLRLAREYLHPNNLVQVVCGKLPD